MGVFYDWRGTEYEPHFPAFTSFPEIGVDLRRVGTSLMDAEQYDVEMWHERNGEYLPTIQGIHRYAQLRASRKDQRKVAWQTRVDRDEEYSQSIQALIERETEK